MSIYCRGGGGEGGGVLGGPHGFRWERGGGGEPAPTEYDDWGGGDYRD